MKIDSSIKTVNGLPIAETSTTPSKVGSKSASSVSDSDSVQISSLVAAQNNGVFDANKVDAIKLARQLLHATGSVANATALLKAIEG